MTTLGTWGSNDFGVRDGASFGNGRRDGNRYGLGDVIGDGACLFDSTGVRDGACMIDGCGNPIGNGAGFFDSIIIRDGACMIDGRGNPIGDRAGFGDGRRTLVIASLDGGG